MNILSIQVGKPQTHSTPDPNAKARGKLNPTANHCWTSGIFKNAFDGPIFLGKTNLVGDEQADLEVHGGKDKAICVYPREHYDYWRQQFGLDVLPYGAFGENFTTVGLLEKEVCIGDTLSVGATQEVIVQVTQPRAPCWKLARRWQIGDLAMQVQDTGYTGWYFRVLQEGIVQPGDSLHLLEHPYPHLTLDEANRVMHHDKEDWDAITVLATCPLLAVGWQESLHRRLIRRKPGDVSARLYGDDAL